MTQVIIYGAGNTAKCAYDYLSQEYDVLCFIDGRNPEKWGTVFCGKKICSPEILKDHQNTRIVIASIYADEILGEIEKYRLSNVCKYECGITPYGPEVIGNLKTAGTIDLGAFFHSDDKRITCKELTFMPGGSGILDYMFIKKVAERFHCKTYLEIGTYIGESVNILTDCCEKLYSITAPLDSEFSMSHFCKWKGIPDYSGRLAKNPKITQYFADSKTFDFSQLPKDIDLFFIDGDHSYDGVYSDTKNIFSIKKEDAIVIWHDAKDALGAYNMDVVSAVQDALGDQFRDFYVTDRNMCGIYVPDNIKSEFPISVNYGTENVPLFTYDVTINNCSIH
ncbi:MAG: class I SAM-dependent methyltransferase [Oscillibacter sp.]|nr:class I SAM-dependent methyltransferase [Oscillibacter sp.]